MPIFTGSWLDGEGVPFLPDCAASVDGGQGKTCHLNRLRPNTRPTAKQLAVRTALTTAARLWSQSMTVGDQAYWLENDAPFTNRKGLPAPEHAYPRFYNANIPLIHSGRPPIYTTNGDRYYYVDSLTLSTLSIGSQQAETTITYADDLPSTEYEVMNVFQVHPNYVDTPLAHKYTMWLGSKLLDTNVAWPPGVTETDWWDVHWSFVAGDQVQLFVSLSYDDEPGGPPFGWQAQTDYWPAVDLILTA